MTKDDAAKLNEFAREVLAVLAKNDDDHQFALSEITEWAADLELGTQDDDGVFKPDEDFLP